jgi:hypothetical protein
MPASNAVGPAWCVVSAMLRSPRATRARSVASAACRGSVALWADRAADWAPDAASGARDAGHLAAVEGLSSSVHFYTTTRVTPFAHRVLLTDSSIGSSAPLTATAAAQGMHF